MSDSGLPASKRNRHGKNHSQEIGSQSGDTCPRHVTNPGSRQGRAQAPGPADLASAAGEGANTGSAVLATFVRFHPCITYFCWLAGIQYPTGRREAKVSLLRHDSKFLYQACVVLDLIFTVIAATAVIALAALVAYKSLSIAPAR